MSPAGLLRQPARTRERGSGEVGGSWGVALGVGLPGVPTPRCCSLAPGEFNFLSASAGSLCVLEGGAAPLGLPAS